MVPIGCLHVWFMSPIGKRIRTLRLSSDMRPSLPYARALFEQAIARGYADQDMSIVIEPLRAKQWHGGETLYCFKPPSRQVTLSAAQVKSSFVFN